MNRRTAHAPSPHFRSDPAVALIQGVSIVRAAGGLLWRASSSGPQLAVVHRPRRDGWSLPKGKLEPGEPWKDGAVREVQEETGCEVRIARFAGPSFYLAGRDPKLVLYWHMALVREGRLAAGDEIDEVAWVSAAAAISRLRHESDRRLVARALRRGIHLAPPVPGASLPRVAARAGAGVALAAGLAMGVAVASPAKRRALVAGGATGLVGAASVVLATLAARRQRRPRERVEPVGASGRRVRSQEPPSAAP
jgi:8-oxo-dGTP diphosphatase